MTTILENPIPVLFFGVIIESVLIALLFSTRKKLWIAPIIVVLLVMIAGLVVERVVVTEREEVEGTIDDVAAALRANDINAVLTHLSKTAHQTRSRAEWALERVQVNSVKVSGLEISVNSLTSPPSAKAKFSGVVKFDDRKKEYPYRAYASEFEVSFRKEGKSWKVTDHVEKNRVD